jgi:hypothetical protein
MAYKTAAELILHKAASFTPKGKRDIAKWLERCAKLLRDNDLSHISKRFVAKYEYESK